MQPFGASRQASAGHRVACISAGGGGAATGRRERRDVCADGREIVSSVSGPAALAHELVAGGVCGSLHRRRRSRSAVVAVAAFLGVTALFGAAASRFGALPFLHARGCAGNLPAATASWTAPLGRRGSSWGWQTLRAAAEGDVEAEAADVAEPPQAVAAAEEEVVVAEQVKVEPAPSFQATPFRLFQELNVSNRTEPKRLMKAIVGVFNSGAKAVDLVLIDPRCRHTLVYAMCSVPAVFSPTAQVLLRRRDRRLRLRLFQRYVPEEDENPAGLLVAPTANTTRLANAVKSRLMDQLGNNLPTRTVKLEFMGKAAAAKALMAIENAVHYSGRELLFRSRFNWKEPPAAENATSNGTAGPLARELSIVVTLTAI